MEELKIRIALPYNNFKRILWADSCGHDFGWAKGKVKFDGYDLLHEAWVKNVVNHQYYNGDHHHDNKSKAFVPWETDTRDKTVFKTKILNNSFRHSGVAKTQLNICEAPSDGSYRIVSTYSGGLTNRRNMLCSIMSAVDRNDFKGETGWSCNVADGAKSINPNRGLRLEFVENVNSPPYCIAQYTGSVEAPLVSLWWHDVAISVSKLSSAGEMTTNVKDILARCVREMASQQGKARVAANGEKEIEAAFLAKFMADNGQMWGTFMQHIDIASGIPYPIVIDEGDFSGFLNWYYMIEGCSGIITNDEYAASLLCTERNREQCLVHHDDAGTGWGCPVWSSPANDFSLPICVSFTLEGSYYTTTDGKEALDRIKSMAGDKATAVEDNLYKLILAGEVVNAVQEQVDSKVNLGRIWVNIVPQGTQIDQDINVKSVDIGADASTAVVNEKDDVIEYLVNVVAMFLEAVPEGNLNVVWGTIQTMGNHLPDDNMQSLYQLFGEKLAAKGIKGKNNFKKKKPKKKTEKKPKKKTEKQTEKKPKKKPKKQTDKKPKKKHKKQTNKSKK